MRKYILWGICVAIVAALSWSIIYDQRAPVDFVSGKAIPTPCERGHPVPTEITRGSCISVEIMLTWRRVDCDLDVIRMVRDGRGWDHKIPANRPSVTPPERDIGRPLGSSRTIALPPEAVSGEAHYRATMKLKCGLLGWAHTIAVEVPPIPFEIKASQP